MDVSSLSCKADRATSAARFIMPGIGVSRESRRAGSRYVGWVECARPRTALRHAATRPPAREPEGSHAHGLTRLPRLRGCAFRQGRKEKAKAPRCGAFVLQFIRQHPTGEERVKPTPFRRRPCLIASQDTRGRTSFAIDALPARGHREGNTARANYSVPYGRRDISFARRRWFCTRRRPSDARRPNSRRSCD